MISFCLPTARSEYNAYADPEFNKHLLAPMLDTLYHQLDEKVELVIADLLTDYRDLADYLKPFEDKIDVKIVRQSNWWLANNYTAFSYCYNQAAEASTGDYLVFLNDCLSFPPGFFSKLKEKRDAKKTAQILYVDKGGQFILSHSDGLESGYTEVEQVMSDHGTDWLSKASIHVGDTRWAHLAWNGKTKLETFKEASWQSCYNLFGIPSETFFKLNGLDENFEGIKGLNDVEFFSRLQLMDTNHALEFDKSLYVYHHRHHGIKKADNTFQDFLPTFRSNYDLLYFMRFKGIIEANNSTFNPDELARVIDGSLMAIPDVLRQAEDYPSDSPGLKHWLEEPPIKQYTQGGRYDKTK